VDDRSNIVSAVPRESSLWRLWLEARQNTCLAYAHGSGLDSTSELRSDQSCLVSGDPTPSIFGAEFGEETDQKAGRFPEPGPVLEASPTRVVGETNQKAWDEPQKIVTQRLLSLSQYPDSAKSSTKGLSLQTRDASYWVQFLLAEPAPAAHGPQSNLCHVKFKEVDNTA
jgi:hypothetical protein